MVQQLYLFWLNLLRQTFSILTIILRWITADYQLAVLSQLCLYMIIMKTNGKAEK